MASDRKLYCGVKVSVLEGDRYKGSDFILTSPDPINVGSDNITFEEIPRFRACPNLEVDCGGSVITTPDIFDCNGEQTIFIDFGGV